MELALSGIILSSPCIGGAHRIAIARSATARGERAIRYSFSWKQHTAERFNFNFASAFASLQRPRGLFD